MDESASISTQGLGFAHVLSGLGIGLLMGTLLGLSLSPVVGAVLGGLTALLAAFLGLSNQPVAKRFRRPGRTDERNRRIREVRAGVFGIACVLGVLMGVFLRAQNVLGVSVQDRYAAWLDLGFSKREARQLAVYGELGLVPEGRVESETQDDSRPDLTVLYSNSLETCRSLEPRRFPDVTEALNAWNLQLEGHWRDLAAGIEEGVPEQYRRGILESAWRLACADR